MSRDITRADFLRGGFLRPNRKARRTQGPRPPWALDGDAFAARCTRCKVCVTACPEGILVMAEGQKDPDVARRDAPSVDFPPSVDFLRGACTFCARCVGVCEPRALSRFSAETPPRIREPWRIKAQISNRCLAMRGTTCRVCADPCPTRAITFKSHTAGHVFPEIDTCQCTGCGACYAPCPVNAISIS
ncbi:ferredoxin-type protein NapF [Varunaivibrio sulfuroxidans]|uniref:Periplasmic nitrate reductase maturation protein NapF n=1 Tax=Varunaivibrio sulfuroxidans TaxID=1773489 RepID=A0A4R3JAV2_9PROT|nr:periplasmic nitrate reductase maturation protein NapF [Varunaivibrio sulfuroxidans]